MPKGQNHTRLGNAIMREFLKLDGTLDCEGDYIKKTPANTARFIQALSHAACNAGYIPLVVLLAVACETAPLPKAA